MLKVAILSYWHVHANDYTRDAEKHSDVEIAAIWDENPERGKAEAEKRNVPFYADLDELLAQPELDGVIVVTPTNMHRDVLVKAAKAGKHIFTEKVIATTTKECNEIMQAVEEAGVKLVASLPRLNDPYTLAIRSILNEETLGQVTLVRTRLSHNGATRNWLPEHFFNAEQCGGGAMIDLGCHPVYLARLFLNQSPQSVTSQYGYVTGKEVEDNAVVVMNSADGALGIAEAGFVNSYSPFTVEVHGTEGTLLYSEHDGKLLLRSTRVDAEGWTEVDMPAPNASAFEQWVEHIQANTTAEENNALGVELTRIMEASNISAREKRAVNLSDLEE